MRKAYLLLSACCLTVTPALAATMASQPWVTNRIAEAEARVGERIVAATNAIPRADLTAATNYTDHALGRFAATGVVARISDGTNTIYATRNVFERVADGHYYCASFDGDDYSPPVRFSYGEYSFLAGPSEVMLSAWVSESPVGGNYLAFQLDPEYTAFYCEQIDSSFAIAGSDPVTVRDGKVEISGKNADIYQLDYSERYVGKVALTNDLPDTASIQQDIADLRTESSLVYRLYSGSNVVAEVTNYNSQVHAPELRLMQLNESNEYITVWTETNGLARTYRDATNYTDGAILDRAAPRAWSRTTSGLGYDAPDGMTWVSTSNLVIAGGLEYEKHVTSGGAIWLLESNGMTADFHASNNNTAYLDISASDGTSIFRIEKTDSFLVGVNVNSVTVDGSTLVCGVNVVATEHPLVRVKAQLSDASWSKEEDGTTSGGVTTISGLASIAWSGTAGNWTCRITNLTGGNSLFAQMEYLHEGGTKIVNTAPLDVSAGILCTDGIHKVRPVYNNGTITWEVVQ